MSTTTSQRRGAAIDRLGLRARVYVLLGALVLVNLTGPAVMIWYAATARDLHTDTMDKDLAALAAAREMENALLGQMVAVEAYGSRRDGVWLTRLEENRKSFAKWLERAGQVADDPETVSLLEAVTQAQARYAGITDAVMALFRQDRREAAGRELAAVDGHGEAVRELCRRLTDVSRERLEQAGRTVAARSHVMVVAAVLGLGVSLGLGGVLAYVLFRRILDPLRRLAAETPAGDAAAFFSDEVQAIGSKVSALRRDVDKAHLDLEERRDYLMQSEKLALAGKLAAGVAHTIRNPLTSVKMRLFSLERTLALDPGQKEDFEVIAQEIGHIDTIVGSFLEFARPPKLVAQAVSPSDVVDTVVNLLGPRLASHDVAVSLVRPRRLPEIAADPDQLGEVLVNLVLNACEAMGHGGTITIREEVGILEPYGRILAVRVSDTGPGLAPGVAENVFQPFFTTKSEGSGLGLAIARRIVEEHGGWITVQSQEGRGATFTMVFPCEGDRGWHRF